MMAGPSTGNFLRPDTQTPSQIQTAGYAMHNAQCKDPAQDMVYLRPLHVEVVLEVEKSGAV